MSSSSCQCSKEGVPGYCSQEVLLVALADRCLISFCFRKEVNAYGLAIFHPPWLSPPSSRTNYSAVFMARDGRLLAWEKLAPLMLPLQSKDGNFGVVSKYVRKRLWGKEPRQMQDV